MSNEPIERPHADALPDGFFQKDDLYIPTPILDSEQLYQMSMRTRRKTLEEIIPELCVLCISPHFTRFWNQEAAHWMHRDSSDGLMICLADPILKKLVGEGHYTFKELTHEASMANT